MLPLSQHLLHCFCLDSANGRKDQGTKAKTDAEIDEERGDLIQFYNSVYVLKMKSFALKYTHPAADSRVCIPYYVYFIFTLTLFYVALNSYAFAEFGTSSQSKNNK